MPRLNNRLVPVCRLRAYQLSTQRQYTSSRPLQNKHRAHTRPAAQQTGRTAKTGLLPDRTESNPGQVAVAAPQLENNIMCMERPRRPVTKINYRKYHLSGDLEQVIQGKVSGAIELIEAPHSIPERSEASHSAAMETTEITEETTQEELQQMLKDRKETSIRMQQQVETMKLRNELEAERLQQEQWALALHQLKQSREKIAQVHEENMERIRNMTDRGQEAEPSEPARWLQDQLTGSKAQERNREEPTPKQLAMDQLRKQQEEILRQMEDLEAEEEVSPTASTLRSLTQALKGHSKPKSDQELLIEQIRAVLIPKQEEKDLNKTLLKALITGQNKATGAGGTSTLRPEVLNKITGEEEFSMAEWLASLNKQDEGESEISKLLNKCEEESDCRADCRHGKMRSGMLDKSTTNIMRKEVWPQKNLGEDWAEEEIEFKQLRFEHLVAGETRTIETCSDPAQILGRLRLLRRIAYLKLRGIEWHLLRKMYAAILSSIETREYSWESNFDRFESILYRRVMTESKHWDKEPKEHKQEPRK